MTTMASWDTNCHINHCHTTDSMKQLDPFLQNNVLSCGGEEGFAKFLESHICNIFHSKHSTQVFLLSTGLVVKKPGNKSVDDEGMLREKKLMRKLPKHVHTMQLWDTPTCPPSWIFTPVAICDVFDLAHGGCMFDELHEKFFLHSMWGLGHLQNHGIAHLDMKPENIFVYLHPSANVTNYELHLQFRDANSTERAYIVWNNKDLFYFVIADYDLCGTVGDSQRVAVGSIQYAAPEVICGLALDRTGEAAFDQDPESFAPRIRDGSLSLKVGGRTVCLPRCDRTSDSRNRVTERAPLQVTYSDVTFANREVRRPFDVAKAASFSWAVCVLSTFGGIMIPLVLESAVQSDCPCYRDVVASAQPDGRINALVAAGLTSLSGIPDYIRDYLEPRLSLDPTDRPLVWSCEGACGNISKRLCELHSRSFHQTLWQTFLS
jgi:hypothetical protein